MRHLSTITIFAVLIFVYLVSCDAKKQKDGNADIAAVDESIIAEGFQLMESNCFSCHSPQSDISKQLAPPMAAIKKHYLNSEVGINEFANDLWQFVNAPSEANSKMPGAIEKFGLMPKMAFTEEQVKSIAHYLFYTEIEAPEWFEKHYEGERKRHRKQKGKNATTINHLALGKDFALSTKAILGKNLLGAIKDKGTSGAVGFCNTRAIKLTDSMATVLNASIKRVSDMPRNPKNLATGQALDYINLAKNELKETGKINPRLIEVDGKKIGFYPIITNEMCMQCHGEPNIQIQKETMNTLADLYPEDKAKGYNVNELRGIWVVEMDK